MDYLIKSSYQINLPHFQFTLLPFIIVIRSNTFRSKQPITRHLSKLTILKLLNHFAAVLHISKNVHDSRRINGGGLTQLFDLAHLRVRRGPSTCGQYLWWTAWRLLDLDGVADQLLL